MPKASIQKLKLLYLAKIFVEKTDEANSLTAAQLIEQLVAYGISAERKSLYADMEALRSFGLDIISVKTKTTGYLLASRPFELPEIKILIDLVQSSKFITQKKSEELIGKISTLTSTHEGKLLQRQVYLQDRIKSMNESIYYTVDTIHAALNQNQKISFLYFEYTVDKERRPRRDGKRYCISPCALTWDDENYYMLGFDSEVGIIKHFRVDKMLKLEIMNEPREGQKQFRSVDLALYSNKLFSMFGGHEEMVTLEFQNELAGVAIDRFGKNVPIVKIDDAHFQITQRLIVSTQLFGWLAGLNRRVRIIAPMAVSAEHEAHIRSLLD